MRKFFIKFSAVIVALVVTISCFCFTSFSAMNYIEPVISFDGFDVQYFDVVIHNSAGQVVPIAVTGQAYTFQSGGSPRYCLSIRNTGGGAFPKERYEIRLTMGVLKEAYLSTESYIDVSYDLITYRSSAIYVNDSSYNFAYRFSYGYPDNYADFSYRSDGGYNYYNFSFTNGDFGASYNAYYSNIYLETVDSDDEVLYLFLDNVDFDIVTPEERSSKDIQNNIDKNTNKIISNQNENADKITSNQDKNTDKILNGDEDLDVSDKTGAVDGSIGDMESATDEALGGKSDEDISNEVSSTLNADIFDDIDFNKAGKISWFFDELLKCFGASYQSVLLLSLSLGLGAFLIGRRYG